jgi:hypothetical protein
MLIIYKRADGGVSVLEPFIDLDDDDAWEEFAQKHVPTGLKYKIVENSAIPTDRTFRNAWDIDEAELTDGVGA